MLAAKGVGSRIGAGKVERAGLGGGAVGWRSGIGKADSSGARCLDSSLMARRSSIDGEVAVCAVARAGVAEGGSVAEEQVGSGTGGSSEAAVTGAIVEDIDLNHASLDAGDGSV